MMDMGTRKREAFAEGLVFLVVPAPALTATLQECMPHILNAFAELIESPIVGRHAVVAVVPGEH